MMVRSLSCQRRTIVRRSLKRPNDGKWKHQSLLEDHYQDEVLTRMLGFLRNDGRIQFLSESGPE